MKHDNVTKWCKTLKMTINNYNLNIVNKLFEVVMFNLKGKAKQWFKIINLVPLD
jgi:hypothetical protein